MIGSGGEYALGAMHVLTHNKKLTVQQAKNHALKALAVSAKFDPHTGPPYHTYIQEYETNKTRKPV